jgi:putative ABC transport system permease protein
VPGPPVVIRHISQDLRFSLRMLAKSPAFTAVAVLSIALGIGANTAVYSLINGVLLRELPYPQADRLVALSETRAGFTDSIAYPNYLDWRAGQKTFENIAVYRRDDFNLTGNGEPERFSGLFVTASYFKVLGLQPTLGRFFYDAEDTAPGANPLILSERLWRTRFGADPNVIGRKLRMNGIGYEVVGVAQNSLFSGRNTELYAPLGFYADRPYLHARTEHPGFYGVGRLKAGISIEQASADMQVLARNLETQYPDSNASRGVKAMPLRESLVGEYRAMLWLLLAAVGLVLLITCANVATLLLARATSRRKEIAIRVALGASPTRIIGQLLTESLVLAVLGGGVGTLIAVACKGAIVALTPRDVPSFENIPLDGAVLGFAAIITLATGLAFGAIPAWKLSRTELYSATKGTETRKRPFAQRWLIVGQVALGCLLLSSAGILVKSFRALQSKNLGFAPAHLLTVGIKLPGMQYRGATKRAAFFNDLLQQVQLLPGVRSAAIGTYLPFHGPHSLEKFSVAGRPPPPRGEEPSAKISAVSPDYFQTMGIPLLSGRAFTVDDALGKPEVVLIDEKLARTFFPAVNPIGERIIDLGPDAPGESAAIVGIVPAIRDEMRAAQTEVQIYRPAAQRPDLQITLLVRTQGEPLSVLPALKETIRRLDSELPLFAVRSMEQTLATNLATQRLTAALIGVFSMLALVLAAIGLYGVLAYSVGQRTREIGIRMALGATRTAILRLILREGMGMVVLGLAAGIGLSLTLAGLLGGFVYGVTSRDPTAILLAVILLCAVGGIACAIPARRAMHVNPLRALREE